MPASQAKEISGDPYAGILLLMTVLGLDPVKILAVV